MQKIAKDAGHAQPLFVGIDQENGLVTRICPPVAAQMPGPMALGAAGSLEKAYDVAKGTADTLRHFGINMNYAPVGDINSEPLNPVIGVRSPGDDPEKVAQYAVACARGMRECKVAPCIKHFPGHGDTAVDSHYGLPVIEKTREQMEKVELVPFRRAAAEGIEMVMTAHISLPKLGSQLPATLAPETIRMLREDLGFKGVIMTDCLEMDGVRATYGTVEGTLMAFQAGVDNVMICHTYEVQAAAVDRLCRAIEEGEIAESRINESLERLKSLKDKYTSWDSALEAKSADSLASLNEKNAALARTVYESATTVVRADPGLIPLSKTAKTVFVSPGVNVPTSGAADSGEQKTRVPWVSASFGDALATFAENLQVMTYTDSTLTEEQWKLVDDADVVILATRNAKEAKYQAALGVEMAKRKGGKLVVVATCNPYDFLDVDLVRNYVAIYEPTVEAFTGACGVLYGKVMATGKLPVAH